MTFTVKLRKSNWENGEYTNEEKISENEACIFFENYRWSGFAETNNECMIFTNQDLKLLCIEKYNQSLFQLYLIDLNSQIYCRKKTSKTRVTNTILCFFRNDTNALLQGFVKEVEFLKTFINSFRAKTFIYKTSSIKSLKEFGFCLADALLITPMAVLLTLSPIGLFLKILSVCFSLIVWVPGLILHMNYLMYNSHIILQVSKGNRVITIATKRNKELYYKDNITHVIQYYGNVNTQNPWGDYGFTKIVFRDDRKIYVTNLLIDQYQMIDKLFTVPITRVYKFFPLIK